MTKMTYVDALNIALTAVSDNAEVTEKLTALREQIAKRNSTENRKPTKAQLANEEFKAKVLAVLTETPASVTEIMAKDESLSALSNQKVSALVNALVEDGKATKTTEKRKSLFARVYALATAPAETLGRFSFEPPAAGRTGRFLRCREWSEKSFCKT